MIVVDGARYLSLNKLRMRAYGTHEKLALCLLVLDLAVSYDPPGNEHGSYYLTRSDATRPVESNDETR